MNYLIVVAHPDDEVLGAGATISKLIKNKNNVAICTMSNHAAARMNLSNTLLEDQKNSMDFLGVKTHFAADFPNIKMNTVPHLELVQFIEKCILDFKADIIITHHFSDTNNDHVITAGAVQAAIRIFQRKDGVKPVKQLLYMEVPSSTDWALGASSTKFQPNYFVEIGEEGINKKIQALKSYKGVMRDFPHPRSEQALRALATIRGAQSGCNYAEAFECAFWRD